MIGVLFHNDTTINQFHIDGFKNYFRFKAQINFLWSLENFKVIEIFCLLFLYYM
jgi:hypothetical protein